MVGSLTMICGNVVAALSLLLASHPLPHSSELLHRKCPRFAFSSLDLTVSVPRVFAYTRAATVLASVMFPSALPQVCVLVWKLCAP